MLWRFQDAVMVGDRGKAWLLAVTAEDAWTKRGVGIGSSLEEVRDAYPSPHCARANEGTEYVQFDYCQVRVRPGRYAAFGDDPVESVTLSRAPLACPGEDDDVTGCPPPR